MLTRRHVHQVAVMKQLRIVRQLTLHIWLAQLSTMTAVSGDQQENVIKANSRTSMSSVYLNDTSIYGPDRAIDGRVSPGGIGHVGDCQCCSMTGGTEIPWWRIDFGKQLLIGGVNITGQPGYMTRQSDNINVYISNTTIADRGSQSGELVWQVPRNMSRSFFTHTFSQPRLFQYMTIMRPDASFYPDMRIVICEVDFIGTECVPGSFGDRCSRHCHCLDTRPCDPVTGKCQTPGCLYGWIGDACGTCVGRHGHESGVIYRRGCSYLKTPNNSSYITTELEHLSEISVETDNYASILNDTVTLTSSVVNLDSDSVRFTADILYNQWHAQNVTPVIDDIFSITNNILSAPAEVIAEAHTIDNAANRIIQSTEELVARVIPPNMHNMSVVKSFLAAEIWEQTGSETDYTIGIVLTSSQSAGKYEIQSQNLFSVGEANEVVINNTDAAIYLRRGLVANAKTKLVFQLYGKTSLFSSQHDRYLINSKVAAAKMFIGDVETFNLNDSDVTAVFTPIEDDADTICGFWNYTANQDAGGWSTSGCKTSRANKQIVCKCDHLTNFAVLIDLEAQSLSDLDKKTLDIVTTAGLVVSIICLSITILTFLVFRHLRSGRGHQVLVNLSVAIVASDIIFLVGIERTESRIGCKAVAALLLYFILVSFMWMLVEGLIQYLRFVKVLGTYIPTFMLKTMIPAWGLPLIPVIVCLVIDHELMYTGEKGYCWLQYDAMLYAFLIPVGVVMAINIVVFLMVMCKLMNRENNGTTNQSDRKLAFLHFQAGVSIFFILGLSWVFGFLVMTGATIVLRYLFAIFNALQGLFIFLLFTFKETKIRAAWRKICCGRKSAYNDASGTDSHQRRVNSGTTDSTGYTSSGNGHRRDSNGSQDSSLRV